MTTGADIQVENGNWFKAHNVIFEQLAKIRLTGREASCLFFLLRQTYGNQVKEHEISLSLWADGTAIDKRHVKNVLDALVERRIIYRHDGARGRGKTTVYGFNKYFEQWDKPEKVLPTVPIEKVPSTVPFSENGTSEKVPSTVPEKVPSTVPNKERREVPAASESSPPISEPTARPDNFRPFIQAYQNIWGLMPPPFMADEIAEWCERVPLVAWEYALKETMNSGKRQNWKYAKAILNRVEFEGMPPSPSEIPASSVVGFSLEDVSL